MAKEVKMINNNENIVVNADKTGNKYMMTASEYKKLMHDNITRDYKLDNTNKIAQNGASQ